MQDFRADFPGLQSSLNGHRLIGLDNAAALAMPMQVLQAIDEVQKTAGGIRPLLGTPESVVEKARAHIARFIGAASEKEIIFTSGATAGINLAARSFIDTFVQTGEEILVTSMDHHSNYLPWREFVSGREGIFVECPITSYGEVDLDAFRKLIGSRTILAAFPYISNVTGTVNPVKEMTEIAHNAGAAVLIDCAQAMRNTKTDVAGLDCDFLVFSGQKLGGPFGTGVLYGKSEMLELMKPASYGGGMVREVTERITLLEDLPRKFEAGTPNFAGIAGLDAAISYLEQAGTETIRKKEDALLAMTEQILADLDRVRILGRPEKRAGAISFDTEGLSCTECAGLLEKEGILVGAGHHDAMPLHRSFGLEGSVRVSPAFYNTEEEIEKFGRALKKILN